MDNLNNALECKELQVGVYSNNRQTNGIWPEFMTAEYNFFQNFYTCGVIQFKFTPISTKIYEMFP
jgi:hypothetical protein